MNKKLYEISADLVQTQVSTSAMSSNEIVESLKKVFNALSSMQKSESVGSTVETTDAMEDQLEQTEAAEYADPMSSIQQDKIICLECGAEMRQLTAKHLNLHGISIKEYKKKWGFKLKQSLSAKSLSKARSKAAKKRGLPENLVKSREKKKAAKEAEQKMEQAQNIEPPQPEPLEEPVEEPARIEVKEPKRGRKK